MTDQNSQFFAILTAIGEAKQANADALGIPWTFSKMAVGDANGTEPMPDRLQTKLINERRRAPLNQVKVDPKNASVIIAEQVIPENEGGWWVREIGLYDAAGDLVAVANCAPTFKPLLTQGSGRTQIIRLNLIVSSTSNIELKIDPSIVLATREYVDSAIINVLPGNKVPGTYRQVTINKYGVVQSGSNPTTLAGYGITDALAVGQYGLGGLALKAASIDNKGLNGGFYYFGEGATSFANYVGLLNLPYGQSGFAGQLGFVQGGGDVRVVVRSVTNSGEWTDTRTLWHSGNFEPDNKASKATTLAGYGIVLPTQMEAEAVPAIENSKPMTALRVAQSIAKRVVQATESALGLAKLGTQVQVDAGADDSVMVTPKKLRWGFQILKEAHGYVMFPTWLGGLVIQWGYQTLPPNATTNFPFPMAFPNACVSIVASFGTPAQGTVNGDIVSPSQYRLQNLYTGAQTARWIAIGY